MICLKIAMDYSASQIKQMVRIISGGVSARRFRKGDYIKHKSQSLLTSFQPEMVASVY